MRKVAFELRNKKQDTIWTMHIRYKHTINISLYIFQKIEIIIR